MKRKSKVYLDTSVVSALFDDKNPDRKELTTRFFDNINKYDVYVSELTISEIDRTVDYNLKEAMENVTRKLTVLPLTGDIKEIGDLYIKFGAVPGSFPEDAYHIAVAVFYEMEYILSWNFKHIVRVKTKDVVRMVNTLEELRQISIITPAELL